MTTSAVLGIPYIASQQSQPDVTHNEALNMLQMMLTGGAISIGLDTPPGSPSEGDVYVVGTSPTGAWAGRANTIAGFFLGSWIFIPGNDSNGTPIVMGPNQEGLRIWSKADDATFAWTDLAVSPGNLSWNALPDSITTLSSLTDTLISSPADYHMLQYIDGMWKNKATNVVLVCSDDDLPAAVGGVITPEAKEYWLVESYSSANGINSPRDDNKTTVFRGLVSAIRTYTGTDAHFPDQTFAGSIEFIGPQEFHAPNGMMWDMKTGGSPLSTASFQAQTSTRFKNCKSLGVVEGPLFGFNTKFGTISQFHDGLRCINIDFTEHNEMFVFGENSARLNYDAQTGNFTLGDTVTDGTTGATGTIEWDVDEGTSGYLTVSGITGGTFEDGNTITDGSGGSATMNGDQAKTRFFSFTGDQTLGPINFPLISTAPGSNEAVFYFDPEIQNSMDGVLIDRLQEFGTADGVYFDTGSLTQQDNKINSIGSIAIPESTVSGSATIGTNALTTTISTVDTPTRINTLWDELINAERLSYQDVATFDGSTDFITSEDGLSVAFNHNLSDGDLIFFVEKGGLPTGLSENTRYYVINSTATTFQVALTPGGSAVDFTGNGTGENYYRHATGDSSLGWVVYTGEVTQKVSIGGWITMTKSGTTRSAGGVIMKTAVGDHTSSSVAFRASTATVQSGVEQSSSITGTVELPKGAGILTYIENRDNDDNLDVTAAHILPIEV